MFHVEQSKKRKQKKIKIMATPKTRRGWFGKLPEPQRSQATANCIDCLGKQGLGNKVDNMRDALMGGFAWGDTPEGFQYWDKFEESLYEKRFS